MSEKRTFVLPSGLTLSVEDGSLSLEFDGDVVLEDTLGHALGSVKAGGDLDVGVAVSGATLSAGGKLVLRGAAAGGSLSAGSDLHIQGPANDATLTAGGELVIDGDVDEVTMQAARVEIRGGSVKAKAISASETISIGDAKLTVDVLQAPRISLGAGATGRVTVIDARVEPGPSKIKGGFSLQDYEEMFGDAATFLEERGLTPLGEGDVPSAPASVVVTPDPEPEPEIEAVEEEIEVEADEETEMLNPDDLEPVDMEELTPINEEAEAELRCKLDETLAVIDGCYEGEAPPALVRLRELVTANDFTGLREDINGIWNDLLKYHQKKRLRPPHQVTHAFNTIHSLIQNA